MPLKVSKGPDTAATGLVNTTYSTDSSQQTELRAFDAHIAKSADGVRRIWLGFAALTMSREPLGGRNK